MILLDLSRPATLDDVAPLRAGLAAALDDIRLPRPVANDLVTAAAEMLNNAVEHGSPPPTTIGLRLELEGQTLTLGIVDDGGPFLGFTGLDAVPVNPLDDALAEGGMGLFIVRRLFADHGYEAGEAGCGGRPNRFWVRHALRTRRRRILLLEDNTLIRQIIEVFLAPEYDLMPCDTVAEALEVVERQRPDLILSDINLPDATGFDLLRELAKQPHTAPVPVVLMTGDSGAGVRDTAIEFGVDDFITKPILKRPLLDTLRRVLNRSDREGAQMLRHLGGELTATLAPALPERLGGWRCAVRAVTAGHGGGDLVFALPGNTVVIADVMGHGAGAKILAHAYAGCFHGLASGAAGESRPGALLSALSTAVASAPLFESSILTAVVVRLEANGRLRLASAGHPPPIRLKDGAPETVHVEGPLAGLLRNPAYPETELALDAGERLFLGTDGLLAEGRAGIVSSDLHPAILAALAASARSPLALAADHVRDAVHAAFGAEPGDDATFVLIEAAP